MLSDAEKVKFVLSKLLGPQVGAKIRILEDNAWQADVKKGEICEINWVRSNSSFTYRCNEGHYVWGMAEGQYGILWEFVTEK